MNDNNELLEALHTLRCITVQTDLMRKNEAAAILAHIEAQDKRIAELEEQIGRLTEEHAPANPYEAELI